MALKGVTLNFPRVDHFDQLSEADAAALIYTNLIPFCESKGVMLSSYGNHNGRGSLRTVDEYSQEKATQQLFSIEKIQRVFANVAAILVPVTEFKKGSYGLKHDFENLLGDKVQNYVSNGDMIAAMLLSGHSARFGKRTANMAVNAEFKVKLR